MESSGNGKVNFDDEDPDMDDWSDFGSDEDEQDLEDGASENDDVIDGMNHEDAFMDADSSDEDGNQLAGGINGGDSESDSFEGFGMLGVSDDDDGASSEDDVVNAKQKRAKSQPAKGKKRKAEASIYADAEEYEKLVKEQLGSSKRR